MATWWLIPLSKWVITPIINGISRVNPLISGVITHLLSGMSHQVFHAIPTNEHGSRFTFSVPPSGHWRFVLLISSRFLGELHGLLLELQPNLKHHRWPTSSRQQKSNFSQNRLEGKTTNGGSFPSNTNPRTASISCGRGCNCHAGWLNLYVGVPYGVPLKHRTAFPACYRWHRP